MRLPTDKIAARRLGRARELYATLDLRNVAAQYIQVLAGTAGRVGLQAVYFLTLANTLTLADFGIFAAISAAGIMLGAFAGFGFAALAFRAAAGDQSLLGSYLGLFFAALMVTLPLGLMLATPLYFALFPDALSLSSFLMIITAEIFLWRLVEGLHKINNGLGRFSSAALLIILTTAARAAAAVVFALAGDATVDTWAGFYFVANGAVTLVAVPLFCPRVQLSCSIRLFATRFRDAMLIAFSSLTFDTQTEVDKLVLITVAGQRAAGIYAISIRILELATIPIRAFYVLYSRKLIREQRSDHLLSRNLLLEAGIFSTTVALYGVFLLGLSVQPGLLGHNIEVARQLFGVALLAPAFRALTEFHSELYFAHGKFGTEAGAAVALVLLKASALAWVVSAFPEPTTWGLWLNAIFAGLYAVSAVVVYSAITKSPRLQDASAAG